MVRSVKALVRLSAAKLRGLICKEKVGGWWVNAWLIDVGLIHDSIFIYRLWSMILFMVLWKFIDYYDFDELYRPHQRVTNL